MLKIEMQTFDKNKNKLNSYTYQNYRDGYQSVAKRSKGEDRFINNKFLFASLLTAKKAEFKSDKDAIDFINLLDQNTVFHLILLSRHYDDKVNEINKIIISIKNQENTIYEREININSY